MSTTVLMGRIRPGCDRRSTKACSFSSATCCGSTLTPASLTSSSAILRVGTPPSE